MKKEKILKIIVAVFLFINEFLLPTIKKIDWKKIKSIWILDIKGNKIKQKILGIIEILKILFVNFIPLFGNIKYLIKKIKK